MDSDTSWCPVCDRQILPKRFQVPITTATTTMVTTSPTPPAPPPSSPVRRSKGSRQRGGGLVQGTGRVKLNGSIKPAPPLPPVKLRTVIDQGPTPLYCSDECQMADINHGLPLDFNPNRQTHSLSSGPLSTASLTETQSSSSSVDAPSSTDSIASHSTQMSPSLATLAAIYNFPPLPPPAPVDDAPVHSAPVNDYSNGIMMAARRIVAELGPKPKKRDIYGNTIPSTEPRKPIPGWTDGSQAWRATVYSFATPDPVAPPPKSFSARSSRGVQSTLTSSYPPTRPPPPKESDSELLAKFSQSFTRCSSRTSLATASSPAPRSPTSLSSSSSPHRRPTLHREVAGKLLVPEVMTRVRTSTSTTSLSTDYSYPSSRPSVRSPLSQASISTSSDEDIHSQSSAASLPHRSTRSTVETRSWSYDNVKTYPMMPIPRTTRTEKRIEKQIVNGEEVEVEIEVVVVEKLKRLFLFGNKDV